MALKSYSKAPIKIYDTPKFKDEIVLSNYKPKTKFTMWDFLKGGYNDFLEYLTFSRIAGLAVPLILIFTGSYILYRQLWPEFEQIVLEQEGYLDQGTTPLVAGDYIEQRQKFLSNPGSDYFKSLTNQAFEEDVLKEDPISKNYSGKFSISLPSIDIKDLPVEANVDSGNEDVYQKVLDYAIAHMQGTGLPISSVDNNIVLYGHSANGDYYERTQDPAGAFSRLKRIKVGDDISITMEGKEYKYKVQKTKIVNPEDVSIINGEGNKHTLTLFTCFPDGNPAKRFVVIARPVN